MSKSLDIKTMNKDSFAVVNLADGSVVVVYKLPNEAEFVAGSAEIIGEDLHNKTLMFDFFCKHPM